MKKTFNSPLCKICQTFAPSNHIDFQNYIQEKIDWKILDTFRNSGLSRGKKQKAGMENQAQRGKLQGRPALGYDCKNGELFPNQDAVRVRKLFTTFNTKNISLNQLSKEFSLSINGIKKILTNRTYLGEVKFGGKIHKGSHSPMVSPEIFYSVQRKLRNYLNRE